MNSKHIILISIAALLSSCASTHTSKASSEHFSEDSVRKQEQALSANTKGKGFGPQSPRDIDSKMGNNQRIFNTAPSSNVMNLCNIHFHKNTEHKGGEFTKNANGEAGFVYNGQLTSAEMAPVQEAVCAGKHGGLNSGDTIELHYVHSTAQVTPGPTLISCLSPSIKNPQLRVETQVYVLVNDRGALNFNELTNFGMKNGVHQALNIPNNTGSPITYEGSTTGPSYNQEGSPFQVSWSVRPKVAKVDIKTVGEWCKGNAFIEDHAHGSRNLVTDLELLSKIK